MDDTTSRHDEPREPLLTALEWLRGGLRPVLVAVVSHEGSVPGTTGARMVVSPEATVGTVGGGVAEHDMVELARGPVSAPRLVTFVHAAPESDSLCSGRQQLALVPLREADVPVLEEVAAAARNGDCGTLGIGGAGLSFARGPAAPSRLEVAGGSWSATLPLGLTDTLTIIGGGHVALALSRVMATLPFRIVVLDDRPDLATLAANHHAHERRTIDYARVVDHVPEGCHSWAVVMTHDHRHDEDVLERLLPLDLRFLGMMGSRSKVRAILSNLEARGTSRDRLATVRAPLGFAIGSHTPAEIAVSIAAELVAVRNGHDPRSSAAAFVGPGPLR